MCDHLDDADTSVLGRFQALKSKREKGLTDVESACVFGLVNKPVSSPLTWEAATERRLRKRFAACTMRFGPRPLP